MMKAGIVTILSAALFLASCSASTSTAKKEKAAADFEHISALIEAGNYEFTVRSASPSGGKTIQITSHYSLKAKEGNYEAHLPYFGRAYSASFGDSGAIEFNGEPEDFQINRNDKKQEVSVTFTIASERDRYTVKLNVGSSGYGNLVISSQKRQTITYSGLSAQLND